MVHGCRLPKCISEGNLDGHSLKLTLNSSPIDELGEGAYESGWWCQASMEWGTQVSTATQRAATTTRHRHTEKLGGDTYQPVWPVWPAKREGKGGANCRTKCTITILKLHDLQSEYASSNAKRRPVCWIGAHDLRMPLTSIGSILT